MSSFFHNLRIKKAFLSVIQKLEATEKRLIDQTI